MQGTTPSMAQQVASAASAFQSQHAIAVDPQGAAKVQEFHRQLFANSSEALRDEIKRITGVSVRQAAAEVETTTGTVVHAFTNGTMVQVFLLDQSLSAETWNGTEPGGGSDD